MHGGKRLADFPAMHDARLAQPHALEKSDDDGRPASQRADHRAVMAMHRQRTGDALLGEMIHQPEEERQVRLLDALFVQRQDEGACRGVQQEVGILRAFGDALVGEQLADRIILQESGKLALRHIGINRHHTVPLTKAMSAGVSSTSRNTRMTGKSSVSVAVTASSTETSKR